MRAPRAVKVMWAKVIQRWLDGAGGVGLLGAGDGGGDEEEEGEVGGEGVVLLVGGEGEEEEDGGGEEGEEEDVALLGVDAVEGLRGSGRAWRPVEEQEEAVEKRV